MAPLPILVVISIFAISTCVSVLNSPSHSINRGSCTMRLRQGEVAGRIEEKSGIAGEVYDSIPYAEAPDGELRFELPRPIANWSGVFNSSKHTHCAQYASIDAKHTTMDCLHVKVIIPLDANHQRYQERLPLVMWIHGGSFQYLGKSLYNTSGVLTAISARKIIFVSVGYRLGMLGFLSLLDQDLPGNYALHDLTTALRFIHANADVFGADPSRISISGESAGAAAASILAVSPLTDGLIFTSLSFSGSVYAPWAVRTAATANNSAALIRHAGCWRETTKEMKKCLQEMPLDELRQHSHDFMDEKEKELYEIYRMGCAAFTPVQDAFMEELSQIPHKGRKQGMLLDAVKVPVLLSTTTDERLVATGEIVMDRFEKGGRSLAYFLPYIMPRDQPSLPEMVSTFTNHYFEGKAILDRADFEKLLTTSQNGEQFAASHAEALDYARAGEKVYVLKADVHDGKYPSWHGIDVWILLDCYDMGKRTGLNNWSYEEWRAFDGYRQRLADVVEEFLYTGSLSDIAPFTDAARSAMKISINGTTPVDADSGDYYFWRQTLPAIESLQDSPHRSLLNRTPVCPKPYQIPFYIATTLLLGCLVFCSFLFSQRRRRPNRDRKALRHHDVQ